MNSKNTSLLLILGTIAIVSVIVIPQYASLHHERISSQSDIGTTTVSSSSGIQTADWKTYANTKYGFRFEYPNHYDSFQETSLAVNQADIYLERMVQGGFQVSYKTEITALSSAKAESHQENVGELRVNIYDMDSYRISAVPAGIEFGFDSIKNQWWQDRGEGKSTSSLLPKIAIGNDLVGYKISIGDAGEGFEYVLIPITSKNVMIEILFYQGIGATQGAPMDAILSTFKLI